jgi:soluble lytic murein transglycosylase
LPSKASHQLRFIVIIVIIILVLGISCKLGVDHLRSAWYLPLIGELSRQENVPPEWVLAVIMAESKFNPDQVSRSGAVGLMQLMPSTAQRMSALRGNHPGAIDLTDPEVNLRLGCRYLSILRQRYPGGEAIVFAAYHAGEGAADRWLGSGSPQDFTPEDIPVAETSHYVKSILQSLFFFRVFWWISSIIA